MQIFNSTSGRVLRFGSEVRRRFRSLVKEMQSEVEARKSRDILTRVWPSIAVFWIPAIAIAVAGNSHFSSVWRTVVWTLALVIMGIACVVNALRCGRRHCFLTGPFFLLMAAVTLLYGLGVLPLGRTGRNVIGLTILVGAMALCCLPEMLFGKYRKPSASDETPR